MNAYTTGLLANSRINELHAEADLVRLARHAATARRTGPGTIARLLTVLRATPHVERSPRRLTTRAAD